MATRKPGRFLAPIALVAIVVVVALVVRSHLANRSHHSTTIPQSGGHLVQGARIGHKHHRRAKFYVVRRGDTLSAISVKTHVPIPILQMLNPGLDPNALQAGQRLRLRR
ncbi:MAG: LysM peptidoglycan-binding domain-containing protein [Solirubrobacteraceae bacterium]